MNIIPTLFVGDTSAQDLSRSTERNYLKDLIEQVGRASSLDELRDYSRSYSGYIREAAIQRCVTLGGADLLPLVVERLNDWVPQVRTIARAGVLTLLPFIPTA